MTVLFKLTKGNGSTRSLTFPTRPTWSLLSGRIATLYDIAIENIAVSYTDSDGDDVTLNSDGELQEFYLELLIADKDAIKLAVRDLSSVRTANTAPQSLPSATPQEFLDDLNRFARAVWGHPQTVLKQHPEGFEYIDLSGYFDAFQGFFMGIVTHEKLLVRNEYRAAFQELQGDRYRAGAYVFGQPGIGKTMFSIYALVIRLGQRQAVAVEFLDGGQYYALFTDTVTFHSIDDIGRLSKCSFVLALSDSNDRRKSPSGTFRGRPRRIRPVQMTSPKSDRWKEWSKQTGAKCYVMDIWSDEEIVQLATLLELNIRRVKTLAKNWGNIPRLLLQYIDEEDSMIEDLYRAHAGDAVEKCRVMVERGPIADFPDNPPPMYYFLRPMKTTAGDTNHELRYVCIPTPTIRRILAEALQGKENLTKLRFYNSLSHHPSTRAAAGYIFESWFHSFFIAKRVISCEWVWGLDNGMIQFPESMPQHVTLIPPTKDAPKVSVPPYYWIPPKSKFPGIDSALVLKSEIFAFQVTISSSHKSPNTGLESLRKMLPFKLKNLPWRMVFVGAEANQIKSVAEHWGDQLFFPTAEKRLPVGWANVDPVLDDVAYTVYRDEETDPESEE